MMIDELDDETRLSIITDEIEEKKLQVIQLFNSGDFDDGADLANEVKKLNDEAKQLKVKIQKKSLTADDVEKLRSIEPRRKSIQNLLEEEVAQIPKFESLLQTELGDKSSFELRQSDNSWKEDEEQEVPIVHVEKRDVSHVKLDAKKDVSDGGIEHGDFKNNSTGLLINFGSKGIDISYTHTMQKVHRNSPTIANLTALYHMKGIVENAVCFDTQLSEPKKKFGNSLAMHKFYSVYSYEGEYYLACLSVNQSYATDIDGKFKPSTFSVYNIKSEKITPIGDMDFHIHGTSHSDGEPISVTTISIPQLYEIVKAYDKNFFENPDAVGRKEREAEIYVQAEYADTVTLSVR